MQVLISPINNPNLNAIYEKAFKEATELYLATAFLTNWSWKSKVQLNGRCKKFLAVIGTSFGLTRKKACSDFLNWLPSKPNMHFILNLLEDCSSGKMINEKFWESFCDIWNNRSDDNNRFRFQGSGVERSCTSSNNWSEITTVLLDIINNHSNDSIDDMDAFVSKSIDS